MINLACLKILGVVVIIFRTVLQIWWSRNVYIYICAREHVAMSLVSCWCMTGHLNWFMYVGSHKQFIYIYAHTGTRQGMKHIRSIVSTSCKPSRIDSNLITMRIASSFVCHCWTALTIRRHRRIDVGNDIVCLCVFNLDFIARRRLRNSILLGWKNWKFCCNVRRRQK